MKPHDCQIPCLDRLSEGYAKGGSKGLRKRLGASLRRWVSPATKKRIKQRLGSFLDRFEGLTRSVEASKVPAAGSKGTGLQPGDVVRVKSKDEIEATLDRWKALKGCSFMPEMWPYCGTTHRVLKRVGRFFDERDQTLRRTKGIVLLEGTICQGTELFGRCDRSCFFFWREEWLEKKV